MSLSEGTHRFLSVEQIFLKLYYIFFTNRSLCVWFLGNRKGFYCFCWNYASSEWRCFHQQYLKVEISRRKLAEARQFIYLLFFSRHSLKKGTSALVLIINHLTYPSVKIVDLLSLRCVDPISLYCCWKASLTHIYNKMFNTYEIRIKHRFSFLIAIYSSCNNAKVIW